ncbi:hypothetical protein SAMN05216439_0967 [Methanobrevibacter gottschalkii]|uniref:DUF116 domain-containing protein n=1 Tax=Methanobrevibacter gottschalkii TaxID=190974 RepID=A0A1H7H4C3_9EURY|nr:DUF116 domain-containing protein [Methanobrevibacter gottschalkii]SEK45078.1 hypothetical protein SAMN05216439_0967 [Methanobrevibacter gottschalkii]
MIFDSFYTFLGQLVVFLAILIIILFLVILVLGVLIARKNEIKFPRFILFVVDSLYFPFKSIANFLKLDEYLIDDISIKVRDELNKEKFRSIPSEKTLIFLPHCLRHKNCPATLQKEGLNCTECGLCSIGVVKKKAEPMGYKMYIVPGSSFVKKIVKENKFKAVLGVACHEDLNQMMMLLSDFCPQGVLLEKTGCFETKVNIKKIFEKLDSKY